MTILELQHVGYSYGAGTPFEKKALDDVSLTVEKGSITGIIGHTGSGKSTLLQLINGLLRPDEGTVFYQGEDIWADKRTIPTLRFRVGLVMQYPEYQLFDETVRSDIGYGPRNMGLSDGEIALRVAEAARYTGLTDEILDQSPFELSGGQKRRAAIAGVLAMRPELLVLDEPAAGLDPKGREEILGGLRAYRDRIGATVVIVSHSMEDMARYCDDVLVMREGRLAFGGSAEEVFSREDELRECGLRVPDVTRICRILREHGLPMKKTVLTIEEAASLISPLIRGKGGNGDA